MAGSDIIEPEEKWAARQDKKAQTNKLYFKKVLFYLFIYFYLFINLFFCFCIFFIGLCFRGSTKRLKFMYVK